MMDIVYILFSPTTSEDYAIYLSTLINDHHQDFVRLYSDSNIIPKMHLWFIYAKIDDEVSYYLNHNLV